VRVEPGCEYQSLYILIVFTFFMIRFASCIGSYQEQCEQPVPNFDENKSCIGSYQEQCEQPVPNFDENKKVDKSGFLGIQLTSSQAVVGLYVMFVLLILLLIVLITLLWNIRKISRPKKAKENTEEGLMREDNM